MLEAYESSSRQTADPWGNIMNISSMKRFHRVGRLFCGGFSRIFSSISATKILVQFGANGVPMLVPWVCRYVFPLNVKWLFCSMKISICLKY